MTRRPGAASGRSLDDVRVRRNQQTANLATGTRLSLPLRQDSEGRMSLQPMPRLDYTGDATDAETALTTLIQYLKASGLMEK
jgi:hypothetical protein